MYALKVLVMGHRLRYERIKAGRYHVMYSAISIYKSSTTRAMLSSYLLVTKVYAVKLIAKFYFRIINANRYELMEQTFGSFTPR